MNRSHKKNLGFTLIEVVAVIGILAVITGMMLPLATKTIQAEKVVRVRAELADILEAIDNYYYDNASYPASLSNAAFLRPYLLPGLDYEAITDDLNPTPSQNYGYGISLDASSRELSAAVWSYGADGDDDSVTTGSPTTYTMSSGDIYVVSYSRIQARQRTRLRLDIIGAALCKNLWDPAYATPNTMTAVADWSATSTTRAALLLLHEFNKDGFGTGFMNTAQPGAGVAYDKPMIYSLGYDRTDDSGSDDDITF